MKSTNWRKEKYGACSIEGIGMHLFMLFSLSGGSEILSISNLLLIFISDLL